LDNRAIPSKRVGVYDFSEGMEITFTREFGIGRLKTAWKSGRSGWLTVRDGEIQIFLDTLMSIKKSGFQYRSCVDL
jgi:hypothetical protein